MALDGQVTYLSTESPANFQRPRTPRRSPRLRMYEEEEEQIESERAQSNLAMRAPIIGYEVVDQRQKFTVYKIEVKSSQRSWFVFRRYTDFTRLNDRLKAAYPDFQIRLPGKRWFKDNFDPEFIEERARGLQFFINNIMNHTEISKSVEVQEFFCLNDPPGPYDSLEESRAYCQHLENQTEDLRQKVDELTAELKMTKSQLVQARVQQEALVSALRSERTLRKKGLTENANNSAQIDDLIEKSEKLANVAGLRGKVFTLTARHRANSKGKNASATGGETEEDKTPWVGSVEITEHSSGADRMRSSRLVRRLSTEKRNPRTSTPVSNSTHNSLMSPETSEMDAKKELEESETIVENSENPDSSNILLGKNKNDTSEESSDHQGVLTNLPRKEPRAYSSKRDSGISVDASPTPST